MQAFDKLTDETLNEAFSKVKPKFRDNKEIRKGFAELRKAITLLVNNCEDNVEVTFDTRRIFDEILVVKAGKGENKLSIIISGKDNIVYEWKRQTWTKFFWDIVNQVKKLVTSILRSVTELVVGYAEYPRLSDRD